MSATRKPAPSACSCRCSTDINGSITKGRGKLDDFGFWEIPCTHGESGAPLQPGATQPEHDGVAHETKSRAREWLINGGGGHEDGEDGIRAMTLNGECLVETLEAYDEWMQERLTTLLERMARLVAREAAKVMCQYCAAGHGHLVNGSGFYVCKAVKLYDQLTPEKLQQLREAVERGQ